MCVSPTESRFVSLEKEEVVFNMEFQERFHWWFTVFLQCSGRHACPTAGLKSTTEREPTRDRKRSSTPDTVACRKHYANHCSIEMSLS